MNDTSEAKLFARPVHVLEAEDGVIIRRGPVRMHVRGQAAHAVAMHVLECCARPNGAAAAEILAPLAEEMEEPVRALIAALVQRRMLAPLGAEEAPIDRHETREDVFLWSFATTRAEVAPKLEATRLAIVGVNAIGHELSRQLDALGFGEVVVIDHPLLRAVEFFDGEGAIRDDLWTASAPIAHAEWAAADDMPDCLVATSDFGGLSLMREWNAFCLREGISFYPVVLQDMVGYAGPLVTPGATACFECFWLRQCSNLEAGAADRLSEEASFDAQIVDACMAPFASAIASIAAFQLYRFYVARLPGFRPGAALELDLVANAMQERRILRAPRCPACGAGQRHGLIAIEDETMPGNRWLGQ